MSEGLIHAMTPTAALEDGERVILSFHPDRATYWRDHAWLAAGAMALGMAVLWAIGNPHVWTGAVGGRHRGTHPCRSRERVMQPPKDPRMSGKIAMLALLVLVALTVVMVMVAG